MYLTFKFHDDSVNTFGFIEEGGGGEAPPQAQELQKSPGGIELSQNFTLFPSITIACNYAKKSACVFKEKKEGSQFFPPTIRGGLRFSGPEIREDIKFLGTRI